MQFDSNIQAPCAEAALNFDDSISADYNKLGESAETNRIACAIDAVVFAEATASRQRVVFLP